MNNELSTIQLSETNQADTKLKKSDLSFIEVFRHLAHSHGRNWMIIMSTILLTSATGAMIPKRVGQLINSRDSQQELTQHFAILVGIICCNIVINMTLEYNTRLLSEMVAKNLRIKTFNSFVEADQSLHDRNGVGSLAGILSTSVNQAQKLTTTQFIDGLSCLFLLLSNILMLFTISFSLTFPVALTLPVYIILTYYFSTKSKQIAKKQSKILSQSHNYIEERLSNMQTVIAFNRQQYEIEQFQKKIQTVLEIKNKRVFLMSLYMSFLQMLMGGCILLSVIIGVKLIESQNLTNGDLMTFLIVSQEVSRNANEFVDFVVAMSGGTGSISKLFSLLKYEPIVRLGKGESIDNIDKQFDLKFENLTFRYLHSDKNILDNVTFDIKTGSYVGIIGHSGSGKSSLIKMLLRLYDPAKGRVLLNGNDIRTYKIQEYHNLIGFVSQEPVLFSGTISQNIRYGHEEASKEDLDEAIKLSDLDFIENRRKGIESKIGERGTKLSGGQKQRLSIARALIRHPKILVFDEATASLDHRCQRIIQESVESIVSKTRKKQRLMTVIVIAHRLSTIRNADKIIVMDAGQVSCQGNHEWLLQHSQIYRQLVRLQGLDLQRRDSIEESQGSIIEVKDYSESGSSDISQEQFQEDVIKENMEEIQTNI